MNRRTIRGRARTYEQRRSQLISMIDRLHDIVDAEIETLNFTHDEREQNRLINSIERHQHEIERLEGLLEYNRIHNSIM